MKDHELSVCVVCGKRFCTDKSSKFEKIRITVHSQLGGNTVFKEDKEVIYPGTPCGTIYIENDGTSPKSTRYCRTHSKRQLRFVRKSN